MAKRLAVLCSGNGSNFEAILRAIRAGRLRAQVVLMLTDNPKAFAVRRARRARVPVVTLPPRNFSSRRLHEELITAILRQLDIDLVVLAGYMRLFTPYFIRAHKGRILNIHPSLLPAFKGAHAIRDAYLAGVPMTGVSVHVVTAAMDAGPVLARAKVARRAKDTLASLERRIHQAEHRLYPVAIGRYLRRRTPL